MQLLQDEFVIDIFEDDQFDPDSADNPIRYDHYYPSGEFPYAMVSQYGIRTTDLEGETISQVCIAASGGKTRPHETGLILSGSALTVCCADTVFSLLLPDLKLRWKTAVDDATCFEIFSHNSGYIVHGELNIVRLDDDGGQVWRFAGPDIFVTPKGKDDFSIEGDKVYARCWYNGLFILDANTGKVVSHNPSDESSF
jgi:outer membrane protein assembly factor BamB